MSHGISETNKKIIKKSFSDLPNPFFLEDLKHKSYLFWPKNGLMLLYRSNMLTYFSLRLGLSVSRLSTLDNDEVSWDCVSLNG